jgi:hypothetical protein
MVVFEIRFDTAKSMWDFLADANNKLRPTFHTVFRSVETPPSNAMDTKQKFSYSALLTDNGIAYRLLYATTNADDDKDMRDALEQTSVRLRDGRISFSNGSASVLTR